AGAAYNVVVTDPLPPGVNWTTSTPGASIAGGTLTDPIGTLNAGATAIIHVSGVTTPSNAGTLTNTAIASASNNGQVLATATASVTVTYCPPVSVGSLLRLGIHHQPTRIGLTFSGALDPTTASNVANYRLELVYPVAGGVPSPIRLKAA